MVWFSKFKIWYKNMHIILKNCFPIMIYTNNNLKKLNYSWTYPISRTTTNPRNMSLNQFALMNTYQLAPWVDELEQTNSMILDMSEPKESQLLCFLFLIVVFAIISGSWSSLVGESGREERGLKRGREEEEYIFFWLVIWKAELQWLHFFKTLLRRQYYACYSMNSLFIGYFFRI